MEEISIYDPLSITKVNVDKESHINIKNSGKCKNKCPDKPCTFICPTKVFNWETSKELIGLEYGRCIECGACILACPNGNIDLFYPRGGYGVKYQF